VDSVAQPKRYTIPGLSAIAVALMLSAPAELTVDAVDHATTDAAELDEQSADTDPVAPILYLTPRVTNILRDVFGTTPEALPQELPSTTPEQPSSSPVADSDEKSDAVEPADAVDETNALSRFQQRMLRTDI
jgi:hypothetical protein